MSSPNPESADPQTPKTLSDPSTGKSKPVGPDADQPKVESSNSGDEKKEVEGEGEGEEEDIGECGFCLFMKAGGCKETFVAWEKCVDDAEKNSDDIAAKCMEATAALHKCMEAHADYYAPILGAEKAAHEQAIIELENEKAAKDSEQNPEPKEDSKKN
ncbi:hypothetical protein CCACVL1_06553 [Corchorus capsularis]|uniref:GCK domain-containing protein n=1 Tax=Corchorus capsularis TaxID=210143 RepID=A0A1R3JEL9_COCAP|nr:hypothetical protein CCACVL1_06553 [Corchorus capsularis]